MESREQLLEILEELGAVPGVRGALVATAEGAITGTEESAISADTASDVAKTVRRMTVASATVGVPLQDLLINFGAARMMVVPVTEDATVVCLLERDRAVSPVRRVLSLQLELLQSLLSDEDDEFELDVVDETEEEIDRILKGELGPVLQRIRAQFRQHALRAGRSDDDAEEMVREQMREWLLCCNPSTYTFPLLVDGLGQLLNDAPAERAAFMDEVQSTIRAAQGG
ncbi:MAG: roadblock/LC7 domain-containing protein [Myxococcota bacterium]